MNIDALVTGGNGFTGSQLSNELARRGKRVRALVRDESKIGLIDPTFLKNKQIELFRGDLRNLQEVQAAVNGVTDVYHIAALYRTAKHANTEYVDVNVGGTHNILQAALHHDVRRVLHCSTIGVHGGVSQIPANEDADIRAGDIYQQTKWQGERLARAAIEEGRRVTIVRPAGIYGPGDLRFLKLFTMVQRRRFIMFGSGDTLMHMVFIDDLVDGMIRAAEMENGLGQTFILAGERYCSLNELVNCVAEVTNAPLPRLRMPIWPLISAATACEFLCKPFGFEPPLHRRRAAFFTKNRAFSIEKAKKLLNYVPSVSLKDGL